MQQGYEQQTLQRQKQGVNVQKKITIFCREVIHGREARSMSVSRWQDEGREHCTSLPGKQ